MRVNKTDILLVLLSIFLIALGVFNPLIFILGIQILSMVALNDKRSLKMFTVLGVALIFDILVKMSYLQFTFMPQAKALLNIETNVFFWFYEGNIHAIRLLIAYPGYLLSKFYNIPLDIGYAYYVVLIFFLLFVIICNVCSKNEFQSLSSIIMLFICMLGLAFVMNGRIIFAFYGYILLINSAIKLGKHDTFIKLKEIFLFVIGICFTAVSSGCMFIGIAFASLCLLIKWIYIKSIWDKIRVVVMFCITGLVFHKILIKGVKYIVLMVNKNLDYFGGGITGFLGMLQHGLGKVLSDFLYDTYILVFAVGIVIIIFNILIVKKIYIKKYNFTTIMSIALNLCCYGILFGFSTGSMGIIPILALCGCYFNQFKVAGK